MTVAVYVPKEGTHAARVIRRGSAVVGSDETHEHAGGRVRIDYEGGLYNSRMSFGEKLVHAADRHLRRYPTSARMWVEPGELSPVGFYDYETRRLDVIDPARLNEWRGDR